MHYHGTPISPRPALYSLVGRCFCVSYAAPQDIRVVHQIGQSVMLDNGAYSFWRKSGHSIVDWHGWAEWAEQWTAWPTTWAVLPDSIEGSEDLNDELLERWDWVRSGVPVWHLHESFERLRRLVERYGRVCFGSSGAYTIVGSSAWHRRVSDAFNAIVYDDGTVPWVHMLRGMSVIPERRYPFASADSTDVGRNHNRLQNTALSLAERWDGIQAPPYWEPSYQLEISL